MFDKYLIGDETLRNVGPTGARTGFAFDARLGYYRGLGLSMIEDLNVTVDGEAIPRGAIRFHDGDTELSLDDMETAYQRRWGFGEWATISILRNGGLAPGKHTLGLAERLRISYLPFPLVAKDEKLVFIQN
jgi:hypothetical protein